MQIQIQIQIQIPIHTDRYRYRQSYRYRYRYRHRCRYRCRCSYRYRYIQMQILDACILAHRRVCCPARRTAAGVRVEKVSMEAFSSAASSSKAPQPTASAAASSSALQPTASSALQPTGQVMASAESTSGASQPTVMTQMWTRIQKFGRFHKQFKVIDPDSEAQHEENVLFNFLHKAKKKGFQMMYGERCGTTVLHSL